MRNDIQLLRGFAVLAVILFHLFPQVFHNGYLGVDMFFVISGYVVTPKLISIFKNPSRKEIKKNLFNFYKIRYYRLAPTLAIVLIFFSLIMLVIGPLQEQRYSTAQGISALVLSGNLYAAKVSANNYFQPNPNPFLHTWSLSVEEQIYLLLPIFILCLYPIVKRLKYISIFIALTIFAYIIYFILLSNFLPTEVSDGALYYSLIFRLWEFGLGACLSLTGTKYFSFKQKFIFFTLLPFIIFLPVSSAYLYPEITCLVTLLYINNRFEFKEKTSGTKVFIWLGNRSYSLYLVHLPITFILEHIPLLIGIYKIIVSALALIFTLIVGNFCWSNIEERYRISGNRIPIFTVKKSVIFFTFLPLALLTVFRFGAVNYYGLAPIPEIQGTISCPTKVNGICTNNIVESRRTVLLIGDSHAAAISTTFNDLMTKAQIEGVVISGRGCQIYERIENISNDGCRDYRIKVLDYLKMHPKTEVLVFQRSSSIEFNKMKNDTLYLQGLLKGLQEIQRYSSKLYVLGPNPEFPSGLSQGSFLGLFYRQGDFPREKMIQNSFSDGDYFLKTLTKNNIIYSDISNKFCSDTKCKYKHENKYLFWDENHLSLDGAKFIKSSISILLNV
jgi:peptidoglycan/LPS O-acetylase OafA/YrhL